MKNENYPVFVGLDFEYATSFKGSICAVGIGTFINGELKDTFYSLVQPPNNEYSQINCNIHKITPEMTANAPTFKEIFPEIKKRLHNNIVVAHGVGHTEHACLHQAMIYNDIIEEIEIVWECTERLIGGKLNDICAACNIELEHHNALSDAIACGKIFQLYMSNEIPDYIPRTIKPKIEKIYPGQLQGDILKPNFEEVQNKENPFYMKKVVISGFELADKERIAIKLKQFGADIDTSVTLKTNILVAGPNVGQKKLQKMQQNIDARADAQILSEDDLNNLVNEIK